jgi:hypothetical protein
VDDFVPKLVPGDRLVAEYDGWSDTVTVTKVEPEYRGGMPPLYKVWISGYKDWNYDVYWTVHANGISLSNAMQIFTPLIPVKIVVEPLIPDMHRNIIRDE